MNLIRRKVTILPQSIAEYRAALASCSWVSFWGHSNTLTAAKAQCGYDLTPENERPAITVDEEGFPVLYGKSYTQCYILTPEYKPGYRPALGEEVTPDAILSWQVLKLVWE